MGAADSSIVVPGGSHVAHDSPVPDPDPSYASETTDTVRHIIRDFLLPVVEPGITFGEREARFRRVRGRSGAGAHGPREAPALRMAA